MKCPVELPPKTAAFNKKNGLVYIGRGNQDNPLFSGKSVQSNCFSEITGESDDYLRRNSGSQKNCHYFVRRADAAKYFPHALPKPRKAVRYFTHSRGFSGGEAYFLFDGKPFFVWKDGRKEPAPTYTLAEAEGWATSGAWKEITKAEALKILDPKPVAPPAPKAPEVRKPKVGEVWRNEHQNYLVARVSFKKGFLICPQGGNRADNKGFVINADGTVNKLCPSGIQHFVADSLEAYFDSLRTPAPDPRIDAIKKILA